MTATLELALEKRRASLARLAPDQLARLERVVTQLRQAPDTMSDLVREDLVELFRWQVTEQRDTFKRRLLTVKPEADRGSGPARREVATLEKVVAALDAALTSPVESPEPLLRALANAKQALTLGAAPAAFSARSLSVRA